MKTSLIIPCFNESKNIPSLLEKCSRLSEVVTNLEIIIVDNGSLDNTPEVLTKLLPLYSGCRSIRVQKNNGYGFGILAGLNAANGEILGWTHADLQTDPLDIINAIKFFYDGRQDIFVKGRRFGRPILDVIFTVGMSFFETILLRKILWDINAQPTMFTRNFFESWMDPPHDFSLDLYAYFLAKNRNLNVIRFPVFFGSRLHGVSSWNVDWKAKMRFIKRTLVYSFELKKRF